MISNQKDDDFKAEIRTMFESFDRDGSGFVTENEIKALFSKLGTQISDAELAEMVR